MHIGCNTETIKNIIQLKRGSYDLSKKLHLILPTGKDQILRPDEVDIIRKASDIEHRSLTKSVSSLLKAEAQKIMSLQSEVKHGQR